MTLTSQIQAEQTPCRLHPDKVSSWSYLLRVTAWCKRFLDNARGRPQQCDSNAGATVQVSLKSAKAVSVPELTVAELQGAERLWISYAQRQCYGEVVSTLKDKKPLPPSAPLTKLQPFLDTDGPPLLRVGGRLRTSHHLSDQFRSPVILPANHRVTQLIVGHEDARCQHGAGTNHLLSNLADRYWIIKGRQVVKSYRHRCVRCQKLWRRPAEPKMGNLPNIQTSGPLQAFTHTGVDYAGPFLVKMGRGRSQEKRYIAVFSCLQTRACHLEVVRSLDVEGMKMALARFCHRRGRPTLILSDNGSNFVATDRELREALRDLDQANITAGLAIQGIRWQFNPPRAPHFGGVFERVVGALKKALQSVLYKASLTDEELQTAVTQAEGMLNTRPLTVMSADTDDLTPLTPLHFVVGHVNVATALETAADSESTPVHPYHRWKVIQQLLRDVWKRWLREMVSAMNIMTKWRRQSGTVEIGDVFLVMDDALPRYRWPLGRVKATFPGKDGIVRIVDIQVNGKKYRRGVRYLVPLDIPTAEAATAVSQSSALDLDELQ